MYLRSISRPPYQVHSLDVPRRGTSSRRSRSRGSLRHNRAGQWWSTCCCALRCSTSSSGQSLNRGAGSRLLQREGNLPVRVPRLLHFPLLARRLYKTENSHSEWMKKQGGRHVARWASERPSASTITNSGLAFGRNDAGRTSPTYLLAIVARPPNI